MWQAVACMSRHWHAEDLKVPCANIVSCWAIACTKTNVFVGSKTIDRNGKRFMLAPETGWEKMWVGKNVGGKEYGKANVGKNAMCQAKGIQRLPHRIIGSCSAT